MTQSSTKIFWLLVGLSTALHAIIFVVWFNIVENKPQNVSTNYVINLKLSNTKHSPEISSSKEESTRPVPDKTASTKPNFSEKKLSKLASTPSETSLIATASSEAGSEKTNFKELNKLLHGAINKNKRYPLSALRLNREGTVQISFQLLKSGYINALKISNSSGYNALDLAALNAVKNIQPFIPAGQYVASVEKFILDVRFQL